MKLIECTHTHTHSYTTHTQKKNSWTYICINDWYSFGHWCGIGHLTNSSVIGMDINSREIKGHSTKLLFPLYEMNYHAPLLFWKRSVSHKLLYSGSVLWDKQNGSLLSVQWKLYDTNASPQLKQRVNKFSAFCCSSLNQLGHTPGDLFPRSAHQHAPLVLSSPSHQSYGHVAATTDKGPGDFETNPLKF